MTTASSPGIPSLQCCIEMLGGPGNDATMTSIYIRAEAHYLNHCVEKQTKYTWSIGRGQNILGLYREKHCKNEAL